MKLLISSLMLVTLLSTSAVAFAEEKIDPLFVPPVPPPSQPVPDWLKYQDPYAGDQKNISAAHRTAPEIMAWVSNTAAQAMSYDPNTFNAEAGAIKAMFTPQGWTEYTTWLKESQLLDMIRVQKYGVSTVANGEANIVNSASGGGIYHWVVAIPLIITFVQTDPEGNTKTTPGGKHRLTVQVGRVEKGADDTGIAIESWKMSSMATAAK